MVVKARDIEESEGILTEEKGIRKRYILCGKNMLLTLTEIQPGTRWSGIHPDEEIMYVLRGKLEYDDGRVVEQGEVTINDPEREHPGRAGADEASLLIEIYSPPPKKWGKHLQKVR